MSKSARPNLADAMREVKEAETARAEEPEHKRPPKKKLTLLVDLPLHEDIRRIAFERRRSLHSLIMGWVARCVAEEKGRLG
jgi:hypothetical protein